MKVKELKAMLAKLDDEMPIMINGECATFPAMEDTFFIHTIGVEYVSKEVDKRLIGVKALFITA